MQTNIEKYPEITVQCPVPVRSSMVSLHVPAMPSVARSPRPVDRLRKAGQPHVSGGGQLGIGPGNFPAGLLWLLHVLQEFFLFDISLFENRKQCTRSNLRMVWNRDESPGFPDAGDEYGCRSGAPV